MPNNCSISRSFGVSIGGRVITSPAPATAPARAVAGYREALSDVGDVELPQSCLALHDTTRVSAFPAVKIEARDPDKNGTIRTCS